MRDRCFYVKTVSSVQCMKRENTTEIRLFPARLFFLLFTLISSAGCSISGQWYGIPVKFNAFDMSMKTVSGQGTSLHKISAEFTYLSFGYLECRGICPGTGAALYRLSREIQDNDIMFLFGEMMPEKNRLKDAQKQLDSFGERFTAFTADSEEAMRFNAGKFHEYFDSGKEKISHTGNIYLIDGSRNIRLIYPDACRDTDRMKDDYERLRKEYGRK